MHGLQIVELKQDKAESSADTKKDGDNPKEDVKK
jgi:hypothetical protein